MLKLCDMSPRKLPESLHVQTGTCEELRPWSWSHPAVLTVNIVSCVYSAGTVEAVIGIGNNSHVHPAFWVELALRLEEGSTSDNYEKSASK